MKATKREETIGFIQLLQFVILGGIFKILIQLLMSMTSIY